MSVPDGSVYELAILADRAVAGDLDQWLESYLVEHPAPCDANIVALANQGEQLRRLCLYYPPAAREPDQAVSAHATALQYAAEAAFGEQVSIAARMLVAKSPEADAAAAEQPDCLNCGSRLSGQYCGQCGQRARARLISLWELITDAFGDLFELDSRLWRTIIPLLTKPGSLTHDYLQGRRARYMPPFRMYLVLSLLFFVVAFFNPMEKLDRLLGNEPVPEPVTEETVETAPERAAGELIDELIDEGVLEPGDIPDDFGEELNGIIVAPNGDGVSNVRCDIDDDDLEDLPPAMARVLTPERVKHFCERIKLDDGESYIENALDNVPAALIILLPLIALVLKVLYPLSRRFYVEHLLFFIHYHSFFFLLLLLQILFSRIAALFSLPETITNVVLVFSSFYFPIYLFVAMRKVYGQGRALTFLKYLVLLTAYVMGFSIMMMGVLTIAAFSI